MVLKLDRGPNADERKFWFALLAWRRQPFIRHLGNRPFWTSYIMHASSHRMATSPMCTCHGILRMLLSVPATPLVLARDGCGQFQ